MYECYYADKDEKMIEYYPNLIEATIELYLYARNYVN